MSLPKLLVSAGILLIVAGALVALAQKLGLGRLPGDLEWRGKNVRVYFPLASSLLISLVLTLLATLWLNRHK